jgi:hypothetical protein
MEFTDRLHMWCVVIRPLFEALGGIEAACAEAELPMIDAALGWRTDTINCRRHCSVEV